VKKIEMSRISPLVSVVIPCFNAERWVDEAIQSCLNQTHSPVEVIVIDDGSTDGSLKIIRSFGEKIQWESGPNRGGNAARNRGFAMSKGDFIQFLDADDFLLPEKISRQLEFLESSGADVVYGDWRHQHHEPDGSIRMEEITISGGQTDVLASLLSGWWVAPAALLYRRSFVEKVDGWDETLRAAQDRDFFMSVAMAGANVVYQPGCHSIYRRHGRTTVSTGNRLLWLDSHDRVLDKARNSLAKADRLKPAYQHALAQSYFHLARNYFDLDRSKYRVAMQKVLTLDPQFQPRESATYRLARQMFGFGVAETFASWKRRLVAR
jgi:glycosyltransferase involved in cell wall biosynthesis